MQSSALSSPISTPKYVAGCAYFPTLDFMIFISQIFTEDLFLSLPSNAEC